MYGLSVANMGSWWLALLSVLKIIAIHLGTAVPSRQMCNNTVGPLTLQLHSRLVTLCCAAWLKHPQPLTELGNSTAAMSGCTVYNHPNTDNTSFLVFCVGRVAENIFYQVDTFYIALEGGKKSISDIHSALHWDSPLRKSNGFHQLSQENRLITSSVKLWFL